LQRALYLWAHTFTCAYTQIPACLYVYMNKRTYTEESRQQGTSVSSRSMAGMCPQNKDSEQHFNQLMSPSKPSASEGGCHRHPTYQSSPFDYCRSKSGFVCCRDFGEGIESEIAAQRLQQSASPISWVSCWKKSSHTYEIQLLFHGAQSSDRQMILSCYMSTSPKSACGANYQMRRNAQFCNLH